MADTGKKAKTEKEPGGEPAKKPAAAAPPPPPPREGREEPLPPARAGCFTWLLVLLLSGILASLVLMLGFVFDYLGILNLRPLLPERVRNLPAVRDYLDEANLVTASEDEKLRFYRQRMEVEFERNAGEIKRREFLLEMRRGDLDRHEKKLRDDFDLREKALRDEESRLKAIYAAKLGELATREVSLRSREVEFGVKVDALLGTSESELTTRISSLAKVYERMEPAVAADALSRVPPDVAMQMLLAIQPRKAAKILDRMNPELSSKFFELMSPEQAEKLKK